MVSTNWPKALSQEAVNMAKWIPSIVTCIWTDVWPWVTNVYIVPQRSTFSRRGLNIYLEYDMREAWTPWGSNVYTSPSLLTYSPDLAPNRSIFVVAPIKCVCVWLLHFLHASSFVDGKEISRQKSRISFALGSHTEFIYHDCWGRFGPYIQLWPQIWLWEPFVGTFQCQWIPVGKYWHSSVAVAVTVSMFVFVFDFVATPPKDQHYYGIPALGFDTLNKDNRNFSIVCETIKDIFMGI